MSKFTHWLLFLPLNMLQSLTLFLAIWSKPSFSSFVAMWVAHSQVGGFKRSHGYMNNYLTLMGVLNHPEHPPGYGTATHHSFLHTGSHWDFRSFRPLSLRLSSMCLGEDWGGFWRWAGKCLPPAAPIYRCATGECCLHHGRAQRMTAIFLFWFLHALW